MTRSRLVGWANLAMKVRVLRRDGAGCHYCGRRLDTRRWPAQLDHVWPFSAGGPNRSWNFVIACNDCNSLRGNDVTWCDCPTRCGPAISLGRRLGQFVLDTP